MLLAAGHPDAWEYPIATLLAEAELVRERHDAQAARDALLVQMAISSIPNMGVKPASTEKAGEVFQRTLRALQRG